ncbi:hypothetical protein QEJ31_08680 [Pigmentibacter sp. JX0631]|uniref:hypothetical protein n=1 Tax=Pigmentibacter sp. JX0631 TaxID=2976982 RepID=UPI0024683FA7|nr:hypothetical protein [Pigmentibacter sp. JX0631]WGL58610.1 hypothetical protein QEJ31_08680 [Pigmentibacter sp. JX0631]
MGIMLKKNAFDFSTSSLLEQYKSDNDWFANGWNILSNEKHISTAYNLYSSSYSTKHEFLLLGDSDIRTNPELVNDFGKTTGARASINMAGTNGAILDDIYWSPLLNDCFILGGIHRNLDFCYAEVNSNRINYLSNPTSFDYLNTWIEFFNKNPDILFIKSNRLKKFNPRVFARELLGLKLFGYETVLDNLQLSFKCMDKDKANSASFSEYINYLNKFPFNVNLEGVKKEISKFLFGNEQALQMDLKYK